MKTKLKILLGILITILIVGLSFQIYTSRTYYQMEKVNYYNLDDLEIEAKYYPGKINKGVILVNDLSHNSKEMWLIIDEFAKLGYHVYTMDFPSQGLTKGAIKYGYRNNDYLAEQYYTGVVAFSQISNLGEEDIHVVASGVSARVVLQTATKDFFNAADLTLIGADTNILDKIQLDVINFEKEEDVSFIQNLNKNNPGEKIHLITTNLNDSSSVEENAKLKEYLERTETENNADVGTNTNEITLDVIKNVLPRQMLSSAPLIDNTVSYIANADGIDYTSSRLLPFKSAITIFLTIIIFAVMYVIYLIVRDDKQKVVEERNFDKNLIFSKILALVPALILVFILPVVLYFLLSKFIAIPYFTFMKISFISCYGIVLFWLYYRTNYANDIGSNIFYKGKGRNWTGGVIVFVGSLILLLMFSFAGNNIVFQPFSIKTVWLLIYTFLAFFIFFIDEKEKLAVYTTPLQRMVLSIINFGSIALVAIVLLVIGKFNIAFDYLMLPVYMLFVLIIGRILRAIGSPTRLNAVIKASLLSITILAPAVMFF